MSDKAFTPITPEDLGLSSEELIALVEGAQRFLPAEDPEDSEIVPLTVPVSK